MIRAGDRYVIEIGEVINNNLYRIKGFNTLVFDQNGLDKLERFNYEANKYYTRGYKEGFTNGKEISELLNDTICVGDEVRIDGTPVIVTNIQNDYFRGMDANGYNYTHEINAVIKTNNHYPEIAKILSKLNEDKTDE